MLKYVIYLAVAALAVWAVVYVARKIARQARGECGCGGTCGGCPHACGCPSKKRRRPRPGVIRDTRPPHCP